MDWEVIKVVKLVFCILVVVNGNIRWFEDVEECIKVIGVDGVMLVEFFFENFVFFVGYRMKFLDDDELNEDLSGKYMFDELIFVLEYLEFCEKYLVLVWMICVYVYCMLGLWFR